MQVNVHVVLLVTSRLSLEPEGVVDCFRRGVFRGVGGRIRRTGHDTMASASASKVQVHVTELKLLGYSYTPRYVLENLQYRYGWMGELGIHIARGGGNGG